MIERTAAKGLFNLALIAAEDAPTIASLSPNDLHKIDEDISRLIELGYRIATLGEAIESLRFLAHYALRDRTAAATNCVDQSNNRPAGISKGLASFSITVAVGFRRPRSISLT